jgi:circadian clock protein KaiC
MSMLIRLLDLLKVNKINAILTALTHQSANDVVDVSTEAISSLADTWIQLRNTEKKGKGTRSLLVVKSRGIGHSNEPNDFIITGKGIQLLNKKSASKGSENGEDRSPDGNVKKRKKKSLLKK